MFEVGFLELTIIAVVALLVVGPERLPALARTAGLYVGKLRRFVSQVRDDVERELRADELKQMLDKPSEFDDVYDIMEETKGAVEDAQKDLNETVRQAESEATTSPQPPKDASPPAPTPQDAQETEPAAGDNHGRT